MAKKKGKKGKKDAEEDAAPVVAAAPPPKIKADVVNYVTLSMNLMNWRFMNFTMRARRGVHVPTETHLFTVKRTITERHGRVKDLVVCKDSFAEKNELRDDMKTLQDYGIYGAPEDAEPVVLHIYYEFKPADHDDPLLLHLGGE